MRYKPFDPLHKERNSTRIMFFISCYCSYTLALNFKFFPIRIILIVRTTSLLPFSSTATLIGFERNFLLQKVDLLIFQYRKINGFSSFNTVGVVIALSNSVEFGFTDDVVFEFPQV